MKTYSCSPESFELASEALRAGKLVVLPTETVYGLAASAQNDDAIHRVFVAKGRPATNPLIVHVSAIHQVHEVASEVSALAQRCMELFWPGPLTLVLPASSKLNPTINAGGTTVAVRMPNHSGIQGVLSLFGEPIVAPSANRYQCLSPTEVSHLDQALLKHVEVVLDGGQCQLGIESTVLDVTQEVPTVLRQGSLSMERLRTALPEILLSVSQTGRSPGEAKVHYAPKAALRLGEESRDLQAWNSLGRIVLLPRDPVAYAAVLYRTLHELDEGVEWISITPPPKDENWAPIWDRINRALASKSS